MGKFNEYTEKTAPDDVDIFLLQDTSATKKVTFLSIFNQIKTKLGLGLLATKSKISEEELETALLNLINGKLTASGMANDLITTDATKALAAPQGKKLLEYIGTLTQLTTVEKANLVGAINELVTSVDALNRNMSHTVNTYHSVVAFKIGNTKMLAIANDRGVTPGSTLNYGTLPSELRPVTNVAKWVVLRDNVTAYLEIRTTGDVLLSRVSTAITSGIWIAVTEMYI